MRSHLAFSHNLSVIWNNVICWTTHTVQMC